MSYEFNIPVRKKRVKKNEKQTLKIGQKVRYAFFTNITFEGIDDEGQVVLKDKSGNIKKVCRSLFEKYVEILKEEEN